LRPSQLRLRQHLERHDDQQADDVGNAGAFLGSEGEDMTMLMVPPGQLKKVMTEWRKLGRAQFLKSHGLTRSGSKSWYIKDGSLHYDLKALVSVAVGIPPREFNTRDARTAVKALGYTVKKA
jgi:hypothetical protein